MNGVLNFLNAHFLRTGYTIREDLGHIQKMQLRAFVKDAAQKMSIQDIAILIAKEDLERFENDEPCLLEKVVD